MKKVLLGVFLGLLLHKGLSAYYSYRWWSAEATVECREAREMDAVFDCVEKDLGLVQDVVPYIIMAPAYTFSKWEWRY